MARIKGFEIKGIQRSSNANYPSLRRATIRVDGKKMGTVTELHPTNEFNILVYQDFEQAWNDAVNALWQAEEPNSPLSKENYFVNRLLELAEEEKPYKMALAKGNHIVATYYDKVPVIVDGHETFRQNGRMRFLQTDTMEDIAEFESTTLKSIPFDRKLYSSPNDFVIE